MKDLHADIVRAHHALSARGLVVGSWGNVSGIDRTDGKIYIKKSGTACDLVEESDIVRVDINGSSLDGMSKPSLDTAAHISVYRSVEWIGGIAHTHSPYATAMAIRARPIAPLVTSIADSFGGEIPCVPYVGPDEDLGEHLAQVARSAPGCLVARHGVFAFGRGPLDAADMALYIEAVAQIVVLAELAGANSPLPPDEVIKWHNRYNLSRGPWGPL